MEVVVMIAQLLLCLSILIVVHEWGHFITARMFKIKVEKFYLFFDFLFPLANVLPFSLLKIKKGDTEYGIGWFPLGGYVKIAGMVDESMDKEQMKEAPKPWEFRSKPAWQRLIVMLGGIIVNVIVGCIIFIGLTYSLGDAYVTKDYVNAHGGIHPGKIGKELGLQTGDKIINISGKDFTNFDDVHKPDLLLSSDGYYTVERDGQRFRIDLPKNIVEKFSNRDALNNFISWRIPAIVGNIQKGSIADNVGLKVGDRFVEAEGKPVYYFDELEQIVKGEPGPGESISFKVVRDADTLSYNESFVNQEIIGFNPKGFNREDLSITKYSFAESIGPGIGRAFGVVFVQLKAFGKIFAGDVALDKSISGPIRMAQMFGTTWDWIHFWQMTGMLSMVLAFMNLLPIPALDGGYVLFLLYEMISGRVPSEKFFETALKAGMVLLLFLMVFVFYNDIAKAISGG